MTFLSSLTNTIANTVSISVTLDVPTGHYLCHDQYYYSNYIYYCYRFTFLQFLLLLLLQPWLLLLLLFTGPTPTAAPVAAMTIAILHYGKIEYLTWLC